MEFMKGYLFVKHGEGEIYTYWEEDGMEKPMFVGGDWRDSHL